MLDIKQLEQREDILSAEPNYIFTANASVLSIDENINVQCLSDYNLWGLENIKANDAWSFTEGDESLKVGIIDSGLGDLVDDTAKKKEAAPNFYNVAHGLLVADVIKSVAKNVEVEGIHFPGNNLGDLIAGLSEAQSNNISIVNFSSGDYVNGGLINAIENKLEEYNGLFICSAGNDNNDIDENFYYPAHFSGLDNVITVGAIGEDNDRWVYDETLGSNYGVNTVSIYAPGENIVFNFPKDYCGESLEKCKIMIYHEEYGIHMASGTSFAAPMLQVLRR